jgi:TPR repeat protein
MYLRGQGVLQSNKNAYAWWAVSAENGLKDALDSLKVSQNKMTSNQIKRGQQLADEISARIGN